jgi:fructokinase
MRSPAPLYKITCFGEILWDILPGGAVPGGAPMNVAYHLHKLGEAPALVTRIGTDERGDQLKAILQQKDIDTRYVQQDATVATGIVHASPDEKGDMKYDIVSPAAWDFIEAPADTIEMVQQTGYFVFGSLITRHKTSRDSLFELLKVAKNKVLDINLRAPFYDQSTIEELLHKADLVKVNNTELDLITGWWGVSHSLEDKIKMIKDKFNLNTVIVTRGAEGAAVHQEGVLYEHPGFRVKVADTVGSGDAFLAGFLHRLLQNDPADKALIFASALGALVASRTGGWPEYAVGEVNELIKL